MSLYTDSSRVKIWNYEVVSIYMNTPKGKLEILPERVKYIQVIHDYEVNVFPIMRIDFVVESDLKFEIMKYKDQSTFYIRIDKFYRVINSKTKSNRSTFIEDTFNLILDDNLDDLNYSQRLANNALDFNKIIKNNMNEMSEISNDVELYLFKTKTLTTLKETINNTILDNVTMVDVISYLCSKAKLKNVLFATPDNRKKIDTVLLPPLSILKSFRYVDTMYGLYKTGMMLYFDYDTTYIIPFTGGCKAWKQGEPRKIILVVPKLDSTNSHNLITGEISDLANDPTMIMDYRTVDTKNESISNNYIVNNDIQVLDSYSGTVNVYESKATSLSGNFKATMENSTENPYIGSTYTTQTNASSMVLRLMSTDIDVSIFKPNREYQVLFEDSLFADKYKGRYVLSSAQYTLVNDNGTLYVNTMCRLKRTSS